MKPEEMLARMAQAAGYYPWRIQIALRELVNAHTRGDLINYHDVGLDVLAITELELKGEDHEG